MLRRLKPKVAATVKPYLVSFDADIAGQTRIALLAEGRGRGSKVGHVIQLQRLHWFLPDFLLLPSVQWLPARHKNHEPPINSAPQQLLVFVVQLIERTSRWCLPDRLCGPCDPSSLWRPSHPCLPCHPENNSKCCLPGKHTWLL